MILFQKVITFFKRINLMAVSPNLSVSVIGSFFSFITTIRSLPAVFVYLPSSVSVDFKFHLREYFSPYLTRLF